MATVGIVCAHYHEGYVTQTIRKLDQITAIVPVLHRAFVANHEAAWLRLNEKLRGATPSSEVVHHDNSGTEFGAYQVGVDRLLAKCDPEWILIANDTFATHSNFATGYRDKLVAELAHTRGTPTIIGRVESLPQTYELAGVRTHRWVTTSIFAINRSALELLNGRVYRPAMEALVHDTSELDAFFSSAVDPVLREHLEVWLFRTRPGWHWYAAEPLAAANVGKMAQKARSILQEKALAAILEGGSTAFVDLKQLSALRKIRRKLEDKVFEIRGKWRKPTRA